MEWSKEQKENVAFDLWIERILTAGASAWGRRGVDGEVVAKRRLGSQVEMWWRSSMKATMRENGEAGSVVVVS